MSKARILIVDDDVDFIESLKVVLESKDYEVFSALSKDEGFKRIESLKPDLIILDVMMNMMSDGFDLSRKLKSIDKYKNIPILMLTAVGDKTGFSFSVDAGDEAWLPVDDYSEKPIEPLVLIAKVEALLAKFRQ